MFPATAILLGPNHLTVTRVDSAGASLESQERSVTTVLTATSTSKKGVAQVCKDQGLRYSFFGFGDVDSVKLLLLKETYIGHREML